MFNGSQNGGGLRIPDKIDWKMMIPVSMILFTVVTVMAADRAVFIRPPENWIERLISILPALLYLHFGDRVTADFGAGVVYLVVAMLVGLSAWLAIERFVIEPMHIKKMVEAGDREQELVNRYREKR